MPGDVQLTLNIGFRVFSNQHINDPKGNVYPKRKFRLGRALNLTFDYLAPRRFLPGSKKQDENGVGCEVLAYGRSHRDCPREPVIHQRQTQLTIDDAGSRAGIRGRRFTLLPPRLDARTMAPKTDWGVNEALKS